jgi:hypothetical protein
MTNVRDPSLVYPCLLPSPYKVSKSPLPRGADNCHDDSQPLKSVCLQFSTHPHNSEFQRCFEEKCFAGQRIQGVVSTKDTKMNKRRPECGRGVVVLVAPERDLRGIQTGAARISERSVVSLITNLLFSNLLFSKRVVTQSKSADSLTFGE